MKKRTIRDIDVLGKRALVRVDYNVPLDPRTGTITDDTRIRATLPTLHYLLDRQAKIVLCSHLGRPGGKVRPEFSLAPVARRLVELLGQHIAIASDCVGPEVERAAASLKAGEVLLLENLRFHPEEEKNDPAFAQALARLGEVFVNESFSTSHRAHASTVGVTRYLPAVAGFQTEKEVDFIGKALNHPERPLAAVIGGSKVSDKIAVLENLLGRVDSLLIGGGMACTFLRAKGYEIGKSLVEEERLALASRLMAQAQARGLTFLLPVDAVVTTELKADAPSRVVPVEQVPADQFIADVGPKTMELFSRELRRCRTVIWNGPMGVYELPPFARGTRALVHALAELPATTILGGGSTAEVVAEMGLVDKMTHISTGGGATLEFLEGKELPGIAALLDKES